MVVDFDKGFLPEEDAMLPRYESATPRRRAAPAGRVLLRASFAALLALVSLASLVSFHSSTAGVHRVYQPSPNPRLQETFAQSLDRCREIATPAGPPAGFHSRTVSDRFEQGTRDLLIRNATIWTGEDNGHEVLHHYDVLVSKGLIKAITKSGHGELPRAAADTHIIDAAGRWLTPGLVDMHVHLSVSPSPALDGSEDTNSIGANINPWLRTVDALNQHDPSFKQSIAGGITAGLVLPGSANSVGGQAFPLKYRQVKSHIPSDRIIDPPASLARLGQGKNASDVAAIALEEATGMLRNDSSSSWRHMKMACGENPRRVYSKTRMDEAWDLRQIFDEARTLKKLQDSFCSKAEAFAALHGADAAPLAEADATFPESLRLEALVDLLRGKVKLNTHCYTQVDFESFIRHTNEFQFPVGAFHHAHEAWLVPELLKKTYGDQTPAIAIFSTNANYKLEAYFGTPFAGAILDSYNVTPIYKSDHPVTDSRRILNQAAQAHHFGLNEQAALRSVTTAPAERLGLGHRIGFVRRGWDADLVLWNNHPLAIGATPVEVVIDGIPQLGGEAHTPAPFFREDAEKCGGVAAPPAPPSADYAEAIEVVKKSADAIILYEKDAFPTAGKAVEGCAIFRNVSKIYSKGGNAAHANGKSKDKAKDKGKDKNKSKNKGKGNDKGEGRFTSMRAVELAAGAAVVVKDGEIVYQGAEADCASACPSGPQIDLKGGVITPGLTSYGSDLGLTDIVAEDQASDGSTLDPLASSDHQVVETVAAVSRWPLARAVDGLQWGGHDLKRARASGVLNAVVAPQSNSFFSGISVRFDTGASTVLDKGAVVEEEVAVHVTLNHNSNAPSFSEQVGWLRRLLVSASSSSAHGSASEHTIKAASGTAADAWRRAAEGELPLVVTALKASQIATLLKLSDEFDQLRLVISGASEAHLLADELARRDVGVLLVPQTWPRSYDELQALVGPPLTAKTTLSTLLEAGVKVALKVEEGWMASNLLWDATRAALETNGLVSKADALGLVSSAVEDVLGIEAQSGIVAWDNEPFEYGAKVVGLSGARGIELVE
ncbi:hypothetical protein ACQY0O_003808 [Thecaphora frezii]